MEGSMSPKAFAFLVIVIICLLMAIAIAIGALLTAWRKIKNQEGDIQRLTEESAGKSNSLREKGCDIDRLEKTIKNLQKQRRRL